jgi:hypothetical protein
MKTTYSMSFRKFLENADQITIVRQALADRRKQCVFTDEFILNLLKQGPIKQIIDQLAQMCPPLQQSCGPDGCW